MACRATIGKDDVAAEEFIHEGVGEVGFMGNGEAAVGGIGASASGSGGAGACSDRIGVANG